MIEINDLEFFEGKVRKGWQLFIFYLNHYDNRF
jgi:hypothetical protein